MSPARLYSSSLAVILALTVSACRSGGGAGAKAPSAPETPAFVQALVGQQRILLTGGESRAVSTRKGEAAPKPDACDAAVEIRQAALQGGALRLTLVYLGAPRLEGVAPRRGKPCAVLPEIGFNLAGLGEGAEGAAVEEEMGRRLPAPEAYLEASGVTLPKPGEVVDGIAATGVGTSTAPERNLARGVTTWPKRLLWVDVAVAAPKKGMRRESEVEASGVVGTDGKLTDTKVLTPLTGEHLSVVKRAANAGGRAVLGKAFDPTSEVNPAYRDHPETIWEHPVTSLEPGAVAEIAHKLRGVTPEAVRATVPGSPGEARNGSGNRCAACAANWPCCSGGTRPGPVDLGLVVYLGWGARAVETTSHPNHRKPAEGL